MRKDTQATDIAVMGNDIANIKGNISEIKADIKEIKGIYVPTTAYIADQIEIKTALTNKVNTSDFDPIKRIVYGLVGIILTAFALGIVQLILKR